MIFARDKSQMCNNLLQFAHVYAWAREHGRSVMSMRFSYKYPYFNICRTKYVSFPLYLFAKYMAALRILPTVSFKHAECDSATMEKKMLRYRHVVVSGWYVRYYDLFLKYRHEICDLFTIDPKYTIPIRDKMSRCSGEVKLGVHIRRGDYATWGNGRYYYNNEKYADFIKMFASLMPDKRIDVFLSTNDSTVDAGLFSSLLSDSRIHIHLFKGNAVEDLYMLSACDYIIGPPSTYSLVAAMYRDVPLCRMDMVKKTELNLSDFRYFDYWFRRIV